MRKFVVRCYKGILLCNWLFMGVAGGVFLFISPGLVCAQTYNVSSIPDSLKKNARVVVREEEEVLEIKSPAKAVVKRHQVLSIFNENGNTLAGYSSEYDNMSSINSLTGTLYDATGKEQKRVKKKDMEDHSYVSEGNLMDDYRYKSHDFYCRSYPYTVEYQEEIEYSGLRAFHDWVPLWAPGTSTQHSRYVIIAPKDYQVRYKPVNCNYKPVITEAGDKKIYTWEAVNLPVRETERWGPKWKEIVPFVMMAPSDFEAQGYKGNMASWENYGKFMNQLAAGRDVLPEDIKKKVHELTDTIRDTRGKVYALYTYMQKNTHYISIQLGIGGWQPFPAEYVATKRYGDCKALSNYMVALLKEAGITGKCVDIRAGEDAPPMVSDFPSPQFNHMISCVPMNHDTIWLECTSQTESPGFMGSFTGNRQAVLIDGEGGHVVRTPTYSAADNLQRRVASAVLNAEGNLDIDVNTVYRSEREESRHVLMHYRTAEEREKVLNEELDLPTYKVDKNLYEEQRGAIPEIREYLHISATNYATITGRRLFINPNVFTRSSVRLPADSVRKYDIVTGSYFTNVDSITITVPPGYQPESVPQDVHIDSRFGKYASSVRVAGDKIVYYRRREGLAGRFPPGDYGELVKFYEQLYKADHGRVVLVKQ